MQGSRIQAAVPSRATSAWLVLLGLTALLAMYGATADGPSWEVEVTRQIQEASPAPLQSVAELMTLVGGYPLSVAIPAVAVLALWLSGQRRLSGFVVLAALARTMSPLLKALIDRPRPSESLVNVAHQLSDPSFPSGHVLGATLFFGFLIYCAEYVFPKRRVLLRVVQSAFALMILLMAYARVQLGEHWPTDAVGGLAIGLLILMVICRLDRSPGRPGHKERFAQR